MNMKAWYVYELVNQQGIVEYVGISSRPEIRYYEHVKKAPKSYNTAATCGLFYKRDDLRLNIVNAYSSRKEAMLAEGLLKLQYGIEWSERRKRTHSAEHRIKIGLAGKGRIPWNKGLRKQ